MGNKAFAKLFPDMPAANLNLPIRAAVGKVARLLVSDIVKFIDNGQASPRSLGHISSMLTANHRTIGRALLFAATVPAMGLILLPLIFVTWLAFFAQEIPSFPPEGYSIKWFWRIADNRSFVDGFLLSLEVGILATLLGLLLGVPASLILSRRKLPFHFGLLQMMLLPLLVPGVVMGTSIYVFHIETELATGLPVLGSFGGLVAAHTLVVIPWVVRLVMASLEGFDRTIEEAALNLGATPLITFWRITLPSIRPGVVAASLFGFVMSFGNLEMSLFLVGPGRTTLPIAILQYLEWKIDPVVAAVSVLQIVLIAAAMIITNRYVKLARVI